VPASRIVVIPNGIEDAPVESPGGSREANPGLGVVSVGRLTPWKGFPGVLEAVAGLPGVPLTIVGGGPGEAQLKAQSQRLGISGRVSFTGDVSQAEVRRHLRAARLLVLNSSYEGLPHVVLEAMQLGTPVVAAASGGSSELIRDGETGLLVAPGSVSELRAAIARVLEDGALHERLSRQGREEAARFGWERLIPEVERVLAEARGRGAHS
jgi:glycosyltransferase involved in cell wall biosynthesis